MKQARLRPGTGFSVSVSLIALLAAGGGNAGPAQQADVALQEESWEIPTGGAFGVITIVVRCGDVLYLADPRHLAVRRYDVATNQSLPEFGSDRVGLPMAMAADCANGELFVVNPMPLAGSGGPGVRRLDLSTAELRQEYPLPPDFLARPGGHVYDDSFVIAGIWGPPDPEVPAEDYYAGHDLGLRLSLETGVTESMVPSYETRCIGAGQCPDVRFDSVVTSQSVLSVASVPTSTAVGVYEGRELVRIVDVDSAAFVRDGEVLPLNTRPDERVRWTGRNSTIDWVFAFERAFAVVHVQRHIEPSWQLGQPTQMSAFMSTYGWDGAQRLQDVRLPGRVVGRGDGVVYTIDSGADPSAETIRILQVPVF